MSGTPALSVVIPTRDRAAVLSRTLSALRSVRGARAAAARGGGGAPARGGAAGRRPGGGGGRRR